MSKDRIRHRRRLDRSLLLLALALMVPTRPARPEAPPPVVHPALDAMEPLVRDQLGTARRRLEQLLATAPGGGGGADPPALGQAYGDLAELYLVYDLVEPASACLENAAALDPAEPRWPHLLGTVRELDRDLASARHWFERATELDPSYLPSRLRLGKVLVLEGETEAARRTLDGVLDQAPRDSQLAAATHAWLGRLALRAGNPEAVVDHLGRALELEPEASALHYPLAQAYRALKDEERFQAHLALRGDAEVVFPDPYALEVRSRVTGVGAELLLARVALRTGDLEAAEARVRRAQALDPSSPLPHHYLGNVLVRRERWEEARDALAEAVRLDPEDVGLRIDLVGVLRRLGRDREIVDTLEPVVALAPAFGPAQAELGGALARLGEDARAESHLERAIELQPDATGARWLYASVLLRQGKSDAARPHLERVVAERPDFAAARVRLAELLVAAGADDAALLHLTEAARLDPRNAAAQGMLARLVGRQGRFLEAADHQAVVVELEPDRPEGHLVLATARILGGALGDAVRGLEQAVTAMPDDPRLADLLARLLATAPRAELRDGERALELATRTYGELPSPDSAETLAMALAENGRFDEATAVQEQVVKSRIETGGGEELDRARARLERYRHGEPVRAPWLD